MARQWIPVKRIVTLSSASTVTLSNLSTSYTDLIVFGRFLLGATSGGEVYLRINGDTGTNYNFQTMNSGPGAQAGINAGYTMLSSSSNNSYQLYTQTHIPSYNSTTTQKTLFSRSMDLYNGTSTLAVHGWETTSAITSISFVGNSTSIQAGATFDIYGISAA